MRHPPLKIEILSPKALNSREMASKIISTLVKLLPGECVPNKFGTHEPFVDFNSEQIDTLLDHWHPPSFFLAREERGVLLSIFISSSNWKNPPHSRISISLPQDAIRQDGVIRLFTAVSDLVVADFSFAQIITERELDRGRRSGIVLGPSLSVTTHNLRRSIPDLYWLTLFGRPYVELWSKHKLLLSPVEESKELNGAVIIRLTPHITDTLTDPERFDELRSSCKAFLNRDAFFDEAAEPGHRYTVPRFDTARAD